MRLTVASLHRVFNRDLRIEFGSENLTSYAGLEMIGRFLRRLKFARRLREAFAPQALGGDYGTRRLVLVVIGLLLVGGRRLEHLQYVANDPLFGRFCALARIPSARTVVNWLKSFTRRSVAALARLNSDLVIDQIAALGLRRATVDLDGTVVRTGLQVAWARRGYNPHHPKDPSYYPLLAHLAQTGQILRVKNRPGNVNDSHGAAGVIREIVGDLRGRFGRSLLIEFRGDAAFFQAQILRLLSHLGCLYAIKVPLWRWLGIRPLIAVQKTWTPILPGIDAFETVLPIPQWGLTERVVVYRKRVHHHTAKNFQLDLFSPDDGTFEYSAVTTNQPLSLRALWDFMSGRGAQEKTFSELKNDLAFDVIPTNHYAANSAWQQLSILAHNLMRAFQLDAGLAQHRRRPRKRTAVYRLLTMKTLRFLLIARAGRLARIGGRQILRLAANPATQQLYERSLRALAA
jgi:Transposase DDE domain group 1